MSTGTGMFTARALCSAITSPCASRSVPSGRTVQATDLLYAENKFPTVSKSKAFSAACRLSQIHHVPLSEPQSFRNPAVLSVVEPARLPSAELWVGGLGQFNLCFA